MNLKIWYRGTGKELAAERDVDTFAQALNFALAYHVGAVATGLGVRPEKVTATWYDQEGGRLLGHVSVEEEEGEMVSVYEIVPPSSTTDDFRFVVRVRNPEIGALLLWASRPD